MWKQFISCKYFCWILCYQLEFIFHWMKMHVVRSTETIWFCLHREVTAASTCTWCCVVSPGWLWWSNNSCGHNAAHLCLSCEGWGRPSPEARSERINNTISIMGSPGCAPLRRVCWPESADWCLVSGEAEDLNFFWPVNAPYLSNNQILEFSVGGG